MGLSDLISFVWRRETPRAGRSGETRIAGSVDGNLGKMIGYLAGLTPEERRSVLDFDGDDTHGEAQFARK